MILSMTKIISLVSYNYQINSLIFLYVYIRRSHWKSLCGSYEDINLVKLFSHP